MRGARILVVDDEPLSRDVLARILASRGLRVETAADGPRCIAHLEQHPVDLVLLDVSMPEVSGLDVVKWIRQRPETQLLPVILVSALIDSDAVVAGLEAGANDYVTKPVNPPVLMARIAVGLGLKRSVDRLLEAERHREMLQALGDAAERLDRPLSSVIDDLERLIAEPPADPGALQARLTEILGGAREAVDLIGKLRRVARLRTEPYTEGLGSLVDATFAEAMRVQRPGPAGSGGA